MEYKDLLLNRDNQQSLLDKEEEAIIKLQKKLQWHEKKREKLWHKSGDYENIVYPLCEEIKKRCGFKYCEIYGPFGICAETSLYFSNVGKPHYRKRGVSWWEDNIDICKEETWHITIQYTNKYESGFEYKTGETINKYPEGSLGELNGMNDICAELPADIDAIIKLLKHSPKEIEGEGTQTE